MKLLKIGALLSLHYALIRVYCCSGLIKYKLCLTHRPVFACAFLSNQIVFTSICHLSRVGLVDPSRTVLRVLSGVMVDRLVGVILLYILLKSAHHYLSSGDRILNVW